MYKQQECLFVVCLFVCFCLLGVFFGFFNIYIYIKNVLTFLGDAAVKLLVLRNGRF